MQYTAEKVLYHAKNNGGFSLRSSEYWEKSVQPIIDKLLDHNLLKWETNTLFADYEARGNIKLYDQAIHDYSITYKGEIALAAYRLIYAIKTQRDSLVERGSEYIFLLDHSTFTTEEIYAVLTKNEKKLLKKWYDNNHRHEDYEPPAEAWPAQYVSGPIPEKFLPKKKVTSYDYIDLDVPELTSMFNMSVGLGRVDSDNKRTESYVMDKCVEELGELSLEKQIAAGTSYKSAGPDGVKGEAVDLAICAMDMFALQYPDSSAEEIEREFLSYMLVKLHKWRNTLNK